MHRSFLRISKVFVAGLLAMTVISGAETSLCAPAPPPSPPVRLGGHIPSRALAVSKLLGRLPADTHIPLAFVLLRTQSSKHRL
ncbi:MAG: hypothetical protein M0023_08805 [Desulfobacteraceae bacterium]|nr:hypothetical protein [Desulfobacteraceae bacterium]